MKKFALTLLFVPYIASASSLTPAQVSAIINLLQSFGADASVVANVQANLGVSPATQPIISTVIRTLSKGMSGPDVTQIQQFLISQQLLSADSATGYFGALTEAAVQAFQRNHAVVSFGTPETTGYGAVGPKTMGAMALLRATPGTITPPPSVQPRPPIVPTPLVPTQPPITSGGGGGTSPPTPTPTPVPTPTPIPTPTPTPTPTPPPSFHASVLGNPLLPALRIDCSASGVCGDIPIANYAYAPADILYQGARHLFFCSGGIPNISFDSVRYINSRDAIEKIALTVPGYSGTGTDMAACDPSVVMFNGSAYLFYGSSVALNAASNASQWHFINTIRLARAPALEGPFTALDQEVVSPAVLSLARDQTNGYLGASWPSAVVHGGKLQLWYMDDTNIDPSAPAGSHYLPFWYKESTDGTHWSTPIQTNIVYEVPHSGEVKYDPTSNLYVMFSVYNANTATSYLGTRYSADGITWSAAEKVADLPPYSHNVGVVSDEQGNLPAGNFDYSFGAPFGLAKTDVFGQWSLYTGTLQRK
jgi:peptidoglycan hydrolase-like protein with peptidoglycan-binding domain